MRGRPRQLAEAHARDSLIERGAAGLGTKVVSLGHGSSAATEVAGATECAHFEREFREIVERLVEQVGIVHLLEYRPGRVETRVGASVLSSQ